MKHNAGEIYMIYSSGILRFDNKVPKNHLDIYPEPRDNENVF